MICTNCKREIPLGPRLNHHIIDINVFYGRKRTYFCLDCFDLIAEVLLPFIGNFEPDISDDVVTKKLEERREAFVK